MSSVGECLKKKNWIATRNANAEYRCSKVEAEENIDGKIIYFKNLD